MAPVRSSEILYSRSEPFDDLEQWPLRQVVDPLRDLIIGRQGAEGTEQTTVQEYGCLE